MKRLDKALRWACVLLLAGASALWAAPQTSPGGDAKHPAVSALIGRWSLDTSRMAQPPDQRPESVVFAFRQVAASTLGMQVDIRYAPGNEVHSTGLAALDGSLFAIQNSPEADSGALRRPTPDVLVLALRKGGVLVSTRIYSVLPGDETLVETAVYPGRDGVPVWRTNYFKRSTGEP